MQEVPIGGLTTESSAPLAEHTATETSAATSPLHLTMSKDSGGESKRLLWPREDGKSSGPVLSFGFSYFTQILTCLVTDI